MPDSKWLDELGRSAALLIRLDHEHNSVRITIAALETFDTQIYSRPGPRAIEGLLFWVPVFPRTGRVWERVKFRNQGRLHKGFDVDI